MRLILPVLCLLWSVPAHAAVGFGAFGSHLSQTGTLSISATDWGTTAGGVCIVVQHESTTDEVDAPTWGGTAMVEMSSSPLILDGAAFDDVVVSGFEYLNTDLPNGTQTVQATVSGSSDKSMGCWSFTGATNLEIVDIDTTVCSSAQADPQVTLSLNGRDSQIAIGFGSGISSNGSIDRLDGTWTIHQEDPGPMPTTESGWYRLTSNTSSDTAAGWLQVSDEGCMIAFAISEVAAPGTRLRTVPVSPGGVF